MLPDTAQVVSPVKLEGFPSGKISQESQVTATRDQESSRAENHEPQIPDERPENFFNKLGTESDKEGAKSLDLVPQFISSYHLDHDALIEFLRKLFPEIPARALAPQAREVTFFPARDTATDDKLYELQVTAVNDHFVIHVPRPLTEVC